MFCANIIIQSRLSDLSFALSALGASTVSQDISTYLLCTHDITAERTRGPNISTGRISRVLSLISKVSKRKLRRRKKVHSKHIFALLHRYNDGSRLSLLLLSIPLTQKFHSTDVASPSRNGPISFASLITESLRRKMRNIKKEPFFILHHHNTRNGL